MPTTVEPMTFVDSLVLHFTASYRTAMRNLSDVSHEESLAKPAEANTMHWVARHLVHTRDRFLPALGQRPVLTAPAEMMRIEELVEAWGESQDRLITGLRALTDEKLAEKAPFHPRGGPIGPLHEFLITCAFHEAYHVGQLGVIRRVIGKPGVM
jgi:uncharacterized damage-inducible protein DinB